MKKNFIQKLAALVIALAIIIPIVPPPCCEEHAGTDITCPPAISTRNFLSTADN